MAELLLWQENQQLAQGPGPVHQVSCNWLQKLSSKWRGGKLFFHHFRAMRGIFPPAPVHLMKA